MSFFRYNTGIWVSLIIAAFVGACLFFGNTVETPDIVQQITDQFRLRPTERDIPKLSEKILAHPKDFENFASRGLAYYDAKEYEKAVKDFDVALAAKKNASWLIGRAKAYNMLDKEEQAIADLNEAISLEPRNDDAYSERASIFKNQKKTTEALADYTKAIEASEDASLELNNRAELYTEMGEFEKAKADYDATIKIGGYFAEDAHKEKSKLFEREGKLDAAVAELNALIKLKDDHYNREYRGDFLERIGRHDSAVADYQKALQVLNENIRTDGDYYDYSNRADVFEKLGKPAEALQDRRKELSLRVASAQKKPNDLDGWNDVLSTAVEAKDSEVQKDASQKVFAIFGKRISENPENPSLLHDRGLAYIEENHWSLALSDFKRAIEVSPKHGDYYSHAADCEIELNHAKEALDYCHKAIAIDGKDSSNFITMARAQLQLGKLNDALASTESAIKEDPGDGAAFFWKAAVLTKLGKLDEARVAQNKASLLRYDATVRKTE